MLNYIKPLLFSLTVYLLLNSVSSTSFKEEVVDYVYDLAAERKFSSSDTSYFHYNAFRSYRLHSKYVKTMIKEGKEENVKSAQNQKIKDLAEQIEQAGQIEQTAYPFVVVSILDKQFSISSRIKTFLSSNTLRPSGSLFSLTNHNIVVYNNLDLNLRHFLGFNKGKINILDRLGIYLQMLLLVSDLNLDGLTYCSTSVEGFAITKDGQLTLYDVGDLRLHGSECKANNGLNPAFPIIDKDKLFDHDSFGLSQIFDIMFFDDLELKKVDLNNYNNSKVKDKIDMILNDNDMKDIGLILTGPEAIEEIYVNLKNYQDYMVVQSESQRIKDAYCGENDSNLFSEFVEVNRDNINNCKTLNNMIDWCKNEKVVNGEGETIINVQESIPDLAQFYQNIELCEIRDFLDVFCEEETNEESFKTKIKQDVNFLNFCDGRINSYCEEPIRNEMCMINVEVCKYKDHFIKSHFTEFKTWIGEGGNCANQENESEEKWCQDNLLLFKMASDPVVKLREFCEEEQTYINNIETYKEIILTYHGMVNELVGLLFLEFIHPDKLNSNYDKDKSFASTIVKRLTGYQEKNKSINNILNEQLFIVKNKFLQIFGIHFLTSLFAEEEKTGERFKRHAKLGSAFRSCNINDFTNKIDAAFKKNGDISKANFAALVLAFTTSKNNLTEPIKNSQLVQSLIKCKNDISTALFGKGARKNLNVWRNNVNAILAYLNNGSPLGIIQDRLLI